MKNKGYEIIKKEFYEITDNYAIVLGYKENSITPYVTWEYRQDQKSYFKGHYFEEEEDAYKDYHERLAQNYNIPF